MDLFKIGLAILAAYSCITAIVFMSEMLMEYVQQKQNEITRYHPKPTVFTIIKTAPVHLKKSLLWFSHIARYI